MEFILEILLQFVLEFLLQVVGQFLIEVGLHALAEPFRKEPRPAFAALGYALLGFVLGAVTVKLVPDSMVKVAALRWLNLLVTPVLVGGAMALLGAWRRKHGGLVLLLDRFSYGYLFALSVALVRFLWAK